MNAACRVIGERARNSAPSAPGRCRAGHREVRIASSTDHTFSVAPRPRWRNAAPCQPGRQEILPGPEPVAAPAVRNRPQVMVMPTVEAPRPVREPPPRRHRRDLRAAAMANAKVTAPSRHSRSERRRMEGGPGHRVEPLPSAGGGRQSKGSSEDDEQQEAHRDQPSTPMTRLQRRRQVAPNSATAAPHSEDEHQSTMEPSWFTGAGRQ